MSDDDEAGSRLGPFWSGTITFGLVSVPVELVPANRSKHAGHAGQAGRAGLRMLGPDRIPLARKYFSEESGNNLDADQMVRGYQLNHGKYVVVTDDELERLAPEKSRDINLQRFVERDSIPSIYFERSYFLTPGGTSDKAYHLLAKIIERSEKAGIATFVMRGKEYVVAIFADKGILRAETLRFADELRSPEDLGLAKKKAVPKASVQKFERAIGKKGHHDLRKETRDVQAEKLMKLVERKRSQGKDIVEIEPPASEDGNVVDIMDVLKKSIAKKKRR
jgi:DNA end-binding protein Ku